MTIGPGKWGTALFVSVAIHTGAAGWFYRSSDNTRIEGGAPVQISMLGDAFQNELTAGAVGETAEPIEPEIVKTSEAEILSAQPSKVAMISEAEPIHLAPTEMVAIAVAQPTELLTPEIQLAYINIASLLPTLLSEKIISPPLLEMEPVTAEPEKQEVIEEVKPVESEAETVSPTNEKFEPVKPANVVEPQKKQEKKKVQIKKSKKKSAKKTARGSNGKGRNNTRAGDAEGSKTVKRAAIGKTKGRKSSKSGNASASNYKGKVRRKVKRSFRRPRMGGKSRDDAVVRFALSKSGAVRSVKLVRSSGSNKLDQAALSAVRRASPFPKPPGNLRGASLNFTLPFGT